MTSSAAPGLSRRYLQKVAKSVTWSGLEDHLEAMVQSHPDYTLAQYCETWLERQGVAVADSTMCRWLQQQALTLKKTRRTQRGERVYDIKPFYRGTRVSVIGAISDSKVLALKALDCSLTGEQFKQFLQAVLAP